MSDEVLSRKRLAKQVWYRDGLGFECQQCGGCCSGAPGYVWVDDGDVATIAARLEMSEDEFRQAYTHHAKGKVSLRERANGDCVLLDEETRVCKVYDERPIQCRTWPWWPENVENQDAWALCEQQCPGIGKGRKHSASYILQELERDEDA
jgi:Fe-S-cluster containining protein